MTPLATCIAKFSAMLRGNRNSISHRAPDDLFSRKARKKRRVKYPHICAAAKAFGVRRESIWRALEGQWKLPKLVARYRAFATTLRKEGAGK